MAAAGAFGRLWPGLCSLLLLLLFHLAALPSVSSAVPVVHFRAWNGTLDDATPVVLSSTAACGARVLRRVFVLNVTGFTPPVHALALTITRHQAFYATENEARYQLYAGDERMSGARLAQGLGSDIDVTDADALARAMQPSQLSFAHDLITLEVESREPSEPATAGMSATMISLAFIALSVCPAGTVEAPWMAEASELGDAHCIPLPPRFQQNSGIQLACWVWNGFVLLLELGFIGVIFRFRHSFLFRSASPLFSLLMLMGLMLLPMGGVSWSVTPESAAVLDGDTYIDAHLRGTFVCHARAWFVCLGLCVTLSSLIVKTDRIRRIFVENVLKKTLLTNASLLKIVAISMMAQVAILCVFSGWNLSSGVDRIIGVVQARGSGAAAFSPQFAALPYRVGECSASSVTVAWFGVECVFLVVLLLTASWCAYATRDVPTNFSESFWIFLAVYVLALFTLLMLPLQSMLSATTGSTPDTTTLVTGFGLGLLSFSLFLILFGSKAYYLIAGQKDVDLIGDATIVVDDKGHVDVVRNELASAAVMSDAGHGAAKGVRTVNVAGAPVSGMGAVTNGVGAMAGVHHPAGRSRRTSLHRMSDLSVGRSLHATAHPARDDAATPVSHHPPHSFNTKARRLSVVVSNVMMDAVRRKASTSTMPVSPAGTGSSPRGSLMAGRSSVVGNRRPSIQSNAPPSAHPHDAERAVLSPDSAADDLPTPHSTHHLSSPSDAAPRGHRRNHTADVSLMRAQVAQASLMRSNPCHRRQLSAAPFTGAVVKYRSNDSACDSSSGSDADDSVSLPNQTGGMSTGGVGLDGISGVQSTAQRNVRGRYLSGSVLGDQTWQRMTSNHAMDATADGNSARGSPIPTHATVNVTPLTFPTHAHGGGHAVASSSFSTTSSSALHSPEHGGAAAAAAAVAVTAGVHRSHVGVSATSSFTSTSSASPSVSAGVPVGSAAAASHPAAGSSSTVERRRLHVNGATMVYRKSDDGERSPPMRALSPTPIAVPPSSSPADRPPSFVAPRSRATRVLEDTPVLTAAHATNDPSVPAAAGWPSSGASGAGVDAAPPSSASWLDQLAVRVDDQAGKHEHIIPCTTAGGSR